MRIAFAVVLSGVLAVSGISADESEAIELALRQRAEAIAGGVVAFGCSSSPLLTCGSTTNANPACLSGEFYLDLWTFSATAGQTITITTTTSTSLPMLLTVQSPSGPILASRTGTGTISLTFTFTTTATYFIGFGYVSRFSRGAYTLQISCATQTPGQCNYSGTLVRGVPVNAVLGPSDAACATNKRDYYKLYNFQGTAGVPVRIAVTAATFPVYLEAATDDSSTRLTQTSDAAEPFMIFYPLRSGLQNVWVGQDLDNPTPGAFTLTITDEPLEPCRRRAVGR